MHRQTPSPSWTLPAACSARRRTGLRDPLVWSHAPITPPSSVTEQPQARRWLISELWADEAAGIVGGVVRQRLAGIARVAGLRLDDLDIHVITAPSVRLDVELDRDALTATVAELRPTTPASAARSCGPARPCDAGGQTDRG